MAGEQKLNGARTGESPGRRKTTSEKVQGQRQVGAGTL